MFDIAKAPTFEAMNAAMAVLRELEACDSDGITDVGRSLAKLSIEPRLGKVKFSSSTHHTY